MDLASEIERNVTAALAEDIGACDWTALLTPSGRTADARVVCRAPAVLCGEPWFEGCLRRLDPATSVAWHFEEGARVGAGSTICVLRGDARALLTGERAALNFLQTLSAV